MHPVKLVRTASFLLFAASFPVVAEEPAATPAAPAAETADAPVVADPVAAPVEAPAVTALPAASAPQVVTKTEEKKQEKEGAAWRGSYLKYTNAFTAMSLSKAADPYWNPTDVHSLSIHPEWHFNKHLFVAASFDIEQELTLSDDTTYANQFMVSDLSFDVGTSGYEEPVSGIRASGFLRLIAPTSLASKGQTKLFSLAPAVSLSRKFDVASGLTVGYSARYTQRFQRYTSGQYDGPIIGSCASAQTLNCARFDNMGNRNTQEDLLQGPFVSFDPVERLHLYVTYWQMNAWLYPLSPTDVPLSVDPVDNPMREANAFILSAGFDVTRELSLSLGASTFTSQPGLDGLRRSPFFNRNTTVSLDVALDIEALLSRI